MCIFSTLHKRKDIQFHFKVLFILINQSIQYLLCQNKDGHCIMKMALLILVEICYSNWKKEVSA